LPALAEQTRWDIRELQIIQTELWYISSQYCFK